MPGAEEKTETEMNNKPDYEKDRERNAAEEKAAADAAREAAIRERQAKLNDRKQGPDQPK